MGKIWLQNIREKRPIVTSVVTLLTTSIIILFGLSGVHGIGLYSKTDEPFGIPYNVWIGKMWNWWISTTLVEVAPGHGGCLMNRVDSMVMVMQTEVEGSHHVCEISSNDSIMIPLWTAWNDNSVPELKDATYEELAKSAREQFDLGAITSVVKVDGVPVAKLDEVSSMRQGSLDYRINAMENVTEIYSTGFNITVPEDTHFPSQVPGTHRAGAHGWFVFLKPLPAGDHTLYYNVGVRGTGPNDHSAEFTYNLKVMNQSQLAN